MIENKATIVVNKFNYIRAANTHKASLLCCIYSMHVLQTIGDIVDIISS